MAKIKDNMEDVERERLEFAGNEREMELTIHSENCGHVFKNGKCIECEETLQKRMAEADSREFDISNGWNGEEI